VKSNQRKIVIESDEPSHQPTETTMSNAKVPDYRVMERIEAILGRLRTGEKLSIKALSIEFGCDTKTIQRDMSIRIPELLQRMNLGVKIEKSGRLFILTGDTANLKNFEETLVFDTLEKLSEGIGANFALKAKKILHSAKKNAQENYLFTRIDFEDVTDKADEVLAIEAAITKHQMITFQYQKEKERYIVNAKPLKLISFDGFWYLLAEDMSENVIKKYYLKSIFNIQMSEEQFDLPPKLKDKLDNAINIWFDANSETFEVRLYANKEIVKHLMRRPLSKSQRIISTDVDGSVELSIWITDYREIISEVLKWIPNLFILSPDELKEDIRENIEEYLQEMHLKN
jgi:predicted DNA-binding transcriptional regulator YafY